MKGVSYEAFGVHLCKPHAASGRCCTYGLHVIRDSFCEVSCSGFFRVTVEWLHFWPREYDGGTVSLKALCVQ